MTCDTPLDAQRLAGSTGVGSRVLRIAQATWCNLALIRETYLAAVHRERNPLTSECAQAGPTLTTCPSAQFSDSRRTMAWTVDFQTLVLSHIFRIGFFISADVFWDAVFREYNSLQTPALLLLLYYASTGALWLFVVALVHICESTWIRQVCDLNSGASLWPTPTGNHRCAGLYGLANPATLKS